MVRRGKRIGEEGWKRKEKKKREEKWGFPVGDKTFVTAKKLKMKLKKNGKEVFNFAKKRLERKEIGRKRWRTQVVYHTHGAIPHHLWGSLLQLFILQVTVTDETLLVSDSSTNLSPVRYTRAPRIPSNRKTSIGQYPVFIVYLFLALLGESYTALLDSSLFTVQLAMVLWNLRHSRSSPDTNAF